MIRKYNEQATENLKNLCWHYHACTSVGFHSSDYSYEDRTEWDSISPEAVEKLVKRGADIYATMPNGSRWLDNIIIIGNIAVLNKLIDMGAIDPNDKENMEKTCWALIENHKRVYGYCVLWKKLGQKKLSKMLDEIHTLINKYDSYSMTDVNDDFGVYQPVTDYKPIFQKLFQHGLDPNEALENYKSLYEMCDARIRKLKSYQYRCLKSILLIQGYITYEDADNADSAEELKEFFLKYQNENSIQRSVIEQPKLPVRRDRHKPKGLRKAKTEERIQEK